MNRTLRLPPPKRTYGETTRYESVYPLPYPRQPTLKVTSKGPAGQRKTFPPKGMTPFGGQPLGQMEFTSSDVWSEGGGATQVNATSCRSAPLPAM